MSGIPSRIRASHAELLDLGPAGSVEAPQLAPQRPSIVDESHLLTLGDVAEYLRVSPRTVRRLMRRGLPCIRFGRSVRFEPKAVSRWLEARQEGG
ncbi:MAG: helix-turn-helix domain-containing protein [Candidatus Eisenbacteria bacterium]|nr:helix-turn-helix domain-containing protein [Candidatus Eisenbacteria bacterium]